MLCRRNGIESRRRITGEAPLLGYQCLAGRVFGAQTFCAGCGGFRKSHRSGGHSRLRFIIVHCGCAVCSSQISRNRGCERSVGAIADTFLVTATSAAVLKKALAMPIKDFEDALHAAIALESGCEAIITRNVRDFPGSPLPALTPSEHLARLSGHP